MLGGVISHSGYGGGCWKHGWGEGGGRPVAPAVSQKSKWNRFFPRRYFHSSDENSHQDHYFSVKWIPAACVLREMNLFPTIDKLFIIYFNTGSFMPFSTDAHFICISHFCRIVPFTLRALSPHSYKGRFNCRVPVLGMMPLTTCIKCSCLAAKNFQDWTVSPA